MHACFKENAIKVKRPDALDMQTDKTGAILFVRFYSIYTNYQLACKKRKLAVNRESSLD